jgi:hypothetical protein
MKLSKFLYLLALVIFVCSCKKDDTPFDVVAIDPQTLSETAIEDENEIQAYLQTHFYNYEEFENPPVDFDYEIKIDTISGDNAGKTPLLDQVQSENINVEVDEEEGAVQHTLYYLVVREGVEDSPTIGDTAFMRYEGLLLNATGFDASTTPAVFNLSQVVRGFGNGTTRLKGGMGPFENGDGTVRYDDHGIGLIIMPSGLGYFGSPPQGSNIPQYSPLMFKVDLLSFEKDTDLDDDGIPSILEDLNMDGNLNNDNTDEDTERIFFPNYNDSDDDGDGILTRDEISDDNGNIIIPYPDTDGDGIPDYLDSDS